ncbi:hypothetical protein EJ04DRAFT_91550 [Polyplosphaeria fusca]|uniref:Aminoglycoside phosphotransferase domain-containing protein n=1 Tax=Polyplosphaeria fusca TaxID=682080 RepID=A0A9P4QJT1_9PLEO|nr:hypothetical protein EJ04DRAFT_91550 [Polyplosphaeria fusca]
MSPNLTASFWKRMGLQDEDQGRCLRVIQEAYPEHTVGILNQQGYCSFTVIVYLHALALGTEDEEVSNSQSGSSATKTWILQIRPQQHALDLNIIDAAIQAYGPAAPRTRLLNCRLPSNLAAFELDFVSGRAYSRCQLRTRDIDPLMLHKHIMLVESFASLMARSWPLSSESNTCRRMRADSPINDSPRGLQVQCDGRVGKRMRSKLSALASSLPDAALRTKAHDVLAALNDLGEHPIVLTHGDLIPSNILIDPKTWRIKGLVDWAEAEWLPFGTCLYGLEHLLGFMDKTSTGQPVWRYYNATPDLRARFWEQMIQEKPEIGDCRKTTKLARDIGVLLWYGYAWDEGAIDRVVNEVDDREELECLRTFLEISTP